MADNVVSQVAFGIGQIDQLLAVYADLVEHVQQRSPDLVEITAMDSVLHFDRIKKLADYLGFRHFYRYSYSFFLEWDKLQGLVTSLREV